jgi:hypothetical protein
MAARSAGAARSAPHLQPCALRARFARAALGVQALSSLSRKPSFAGRGVSPHAALILRKSLHGLRLSIKAGPSLLLGAPRRPSPCEGDSGSIRSRLKDRQKDAEGRVRSPEMKHARLMHRDYGKHLGPAKTAISYTASYTYTNNI